MGFDSYWKLLFIGDFPIKHKVIFHSCVSLPEGKCSMNLSCFFFFSSLSLFYMYYVYYVYDVFCIYMYITVYIYVYVYVYVDVYVYVFVHVHIYAYIYMYAYVYVITCYFHRYLYRCAQVYVHIMDGGSIGVSLVRTIPQRFRILFGIAAVHRIWKPESCTEISPQVAYIYIYVYIYMYIYMYIYIYYIYIYIHVYIIRGHRIKRTTAAVHRKWIWNQKSLHMDGALSKDEFPELQRCGSSQSWTWKLGAEDAHQERISWWSTWGSANLWLPSGTNSLKMAIWKQLIYPLKMVISHSYVSLPEGIYP